MASKTYFNDGGVIINSAMFITPDGSQYPVRNISAVRMKSQDRLPWFIVSGLFMVFAIVVGSSGELASMPVLILLSLLCLGVWFFGRNFQLVISSGGVEVAALSYNQREKNKKEFLTRALSALSLAITDLQS